MLENAQNVFFLGIKGVAQANLAVILKKMGRNISGADVDEEFITDEILKANGIEYGSLKDSDLPEKTDLVIYSAAHEGKNNLLVKKAIESGIKTAHQAEILGELMNQYKTKIAVSGCHGKTTTSSLVAYALTNLEVDPGYAIGVPKFGTRPGASLGKKDYFVIEADEYGVNPPADKTPKFNFLDPDYIICTNIDFDHPDVYANLEETKQAFFKFFEDKKLIVCNDDKNIVQSINRLENRQYFTYGFQSSATMQIKNLKTKADKTSFDLVLRGKSLGSFEISLFGEKNVSNAAAAIYLLIQLGFDVGKIKTAIREFGGAERRFEKIAEINGIYLFDDYAHHPSEIEATINAARNRFPGKRILIIFQPHTYSRTQSLLNQFSHALSKADFAFILPIFASAREDKSKFNITSENIVEVSKKNNLTAVKDPSQLNIKLEKILKTGDVVFTMGAGDVYKLKYDLIKLMNNRSNSENKIVNNKDITGQLTMRVKTIAENYFEAKSREDLISILRASHEMKLPLHLLGGGSNLIFSEEKVPGLLVQNRYIKKELIKEDSEFALLSVSSGYPVNLLVSETISEGLSGFEYFAGLPGTVGGAIFMNSKWTKPPTFFGDSLVYAYILDKHGSIKKVDKDYFRFAYGFSLLQETDEILLEAVFRLEKKDSGELKAIAKQVIDYRNQTQPKGFTNGCFFKNPEGQSAGYLIDQAGLKGLTVGDFYVSDKHANFIINRANGKIEDLKKIIKIIKEKVRAKFGVELEEEVILR